VIRGLHLCNGTIGDGQGQRVLRNATWVPLLQELVAIDIAHLEASYFSGDLERGAFKDLPRSTQLAAGDRRRKPTTGSNRSRRSRNARPTGVVSSVRSDSAVAILAGSGVTTARVTVTARVLRAKMTNLAEAAATF